MIGCDRELVQAAAMSLSRLAGRLSQKYGVPIQDKHHMSDGVLRQVDMIVRGLARDAFQEGYYRGCRAGVEAADPQGWADVRIPGQTAVCNVPFLGRTEIPMAPKLVQRQASTIPSSTAAIESTPPQ